MNEEMILKVYKYWNKTEAGKELVESKSVSDVDLLFMIPNNKKKLLGLPMTRINKKKKKRHKNRRLRRCILNYRFFDYLDQYVDKYVVDINFNHFADYKSLKIGITNTVDTTCNTKCSYLANKCDRLIMSSL